MGNFKSFYLVYFYFRFKLFANSYLSSQYFHNGYRIIYANTNYRKVLKLLSNLMI